MGIHLTKKSRWQITTSYFWMIIGCFLAAYALRAFFAPNKLIDGGIIGISMILGQLYSHALFPVYFVVLTLPFVYLSYKFIRRTFVIQLVIAVIIFSGFLGLLDTANAVTQDPLEVIVFGGAILGIGVGLIIRSGGCLDGTEILAIIINRKKGFTVGQVVLFINVFIFAAYGYIFQDWHIAFRSLMAYFVAFKTMDVVIVGLDELKSVMIISSKPKKVAQAIMHELGLGLTVMYGRGGYSGDAREILFVIVERLDLADVKELILQADPEAFIAIENLHEVVYGRAPKSAPTTRKRKSRIA